MIKKAPAQKKTKPKVVSINPPDPAPPTPFKARLIAADEATHRYIISVGRDRIAYDMTTRITRLAATTGDQPAQVLPIKQPRGKKS